MPLSDRRSTHALGLCMCTMLATALTASAQAPGEDSTKAKAPPGKAAIAATPPQPTVPAAVQEAIARIATALEESNKRTGDPTERRRSTLDLEAQQSMALWAFWAFIAAAASAFLTAVGVYLVGRTLIYTKRTLEEAQAATKAARDGVDEAKRTTAAAERAAVIAQQTAQLELRAYLSVEPGGINQLIGSDQGMGHVVVRNVGKLPARNVTVFVHMRLSYESDSDFPTLFDNETIDRVVQPNAEMRQGSDETLPITEALRPGKAVFVWGLANYDDGYGYRRFTKFCHRYATASYNRRDDWNGKATSTRSMIDSDKARYHTIGNNAD